MKDFHVMLAYLTVIGFIVRGLWSISGSELRHQKWVKILPHLIDTLLLTLGVAMAIQLSLSVTSDWLLAKLMGLLAYIGFGVVTMRATTKPVKILGFIAALLSATYILIVAFSRSAWPF